MSRWTTFTPSAMTTPRRSGRTSASIRSQKSATRGSAGSSISTSCTVLILAPQDVARLSAAADEHEDESQHGRCTLHEQDAARHGQPTDDRGHDDTAEAIHLELERRLVVAHGKTEH